MENVNEQKNKNEVKPKRNTPLFILKIVGNVIFYLIIIALFIFALMNIRGGKTNFPNIFGRGFLSVQSSSMERSPDKNQPAEWANYEIKEIKKGDLVFVKTFSGKVEDLKVGDVVTWYDSSIGSTGALNTHRIVYINAQEKYIIAQGDYIAQTSPFDKNDPTSYYNYTLEASGAIQNVSVEAILGVTTGVWSGAGKVLDNMQKNWLWYFVVPIAVLLLIELFFVFKNIMDYRNEKKRLVEGDKAKEDIKAELEAEREKMKAELLAELKASGVIQEKVEDAPVEEKPVEEPKEEVVVAPVEEVKETQSQEAKEPEVVEEEENLDEKPVLEEKEETPKESLKEETVVLVSNPQETETEDVKTSQEDVSELISDIETAKDSKIVAKEIERIETEKGQKEVEKAMKAAEKAKAPKKKTTTKKEKETEEVKEAPKQTGRKKAGEGETKPAGRKKAGEDTAPQKTGRKKAGEDAPKTGRAKAGEKPAGRAKAGSKK